MQEAFPVAKALYEKGFHAFVLQYRCGKHATAPVPIEDLAKAIRFVLSHADEYRIDVDDYALIGFSAGGHLSACFGLETIGYKRYGLPKPGILMLAYPVISMEEHSHAGSRKNFLGKGESDGQMRALYSSDGQMRALYSVERHVTSDYPAVYIWQCERDNTVPIQNSRLMVQALENAGMPYRYETFDSDAHGWGLGTGTAADGWLDRAVDFWKTWRKFRA